MAQATAAGLKDPQVQATLLGEAIASAEVGFLIWDDDGRYVAANTRACELLGGTREQLLGSPAAGVPREEGARGRATVERIDGRSIALEYVTFAVRTAAMPFSASMIWPADE